MSKKLRTYRIIRTIEEEYTVQAVNKKHASEVLNEGAQVQSVKVVREQIEWVDRPLTLPPGYTILELNFRKPNR